MSKKRTFIPELMEKNKKVLRFGKSWEISLSLYNRIL